jgi:mannose-6-phosphate isomerase-like protein (cupin superfamily)
MDASSLAAAEPFVTADGSTIRELAGHVSAPTVHQSLAEATVPPGGATIAHYHREAEELYLFTAGRGRLRVGDEQREVAAGDCVVIPPGAPHQLWNTSRSEPLVLLCCCAPAYRHEDTVLLEPGDGQG